MDNIEGYNSYRMLNRMMYCAEQGETEKLLGLMKQYSRVQETVNQLLKPL
jgi:hypothetical protein